MDINIKRFLSNINILKTLLCESDKIEEFQCPCCLDSIYEKEIFQCLKGHIRCGECWEKSNNICSKCDNVTIDHLSRNLMGEKFFNNEKIYCINSLSKEIFQNCNLNNLDDEVVRRDKNGCEQILSIKDLKEHIENCNYGFKECEHKNEGCPEIIRVEKDLRYHQHGCEYKIIFCTYCKEGFHRNKMKDHHLECGNIDIECELCNKNFKRNSMKDHLNLECENAKVPCIFKEFGCEEEFKRSESKEHYGINHLNHIKKLIEQLNESKEEIKIVKKKVDILNETANIEILNQKERIDFLEKENLKLKNENKKVIVEIKTIIERMGGTIQIEKNNNKFLSIIDRVSKLEILYWKMYEKKEKKRILNKGLDNILPFRNVKFSFSKNSYHVYKKEYDGEDNDEDEDAYDEDDDAYDEDDNSYDEDDGAYDEDDESSCEHDEVEDDDINRSLA